MAFEKFGKIIGNFASTTAKKAGEQVQITKLGIDRAGLEKQIEGVYAAIGRYCYSRAKAGETLPDEMLDYCRDIDLLYEQIESIDTEVLQRKQERDAAEYSVSPDMDGIATPLAFEEDFASEEVSADFEESVASATAELDAQDIVAEAVAEINDVAEAVTEAVVEKVEPIVTAVEAAVEDAVVAPAATED